MSEVGIVIVNYNGEKFQNDCIASLYEMTFQDFEIVVVDSGSKDNSISLLRQHFPKVHILEQGDNVGVAFGNNIGIEYCRNIGVKSVLLLNNDVEVHPDLLDILLRESRNQYVVVPKIYYYEPKDMIWFAGGEFVLKKGLTTHRGKREKDCGQYDEVARITYAPTCCMLIPMHVFDVVGGIDENYFMYYDDTDFCLRLMKKRIEMLYIPKAIMWHKVSSSTGGEDSPLSVYYNTRNRFYYIKKHQDVMPKTVLLYSWVSNVVQYILSPIRCKNDKYILPALKDYVKGNMGRKDGLMKKKTT